MQNVTIIGMGLIGGSIGLGLRRWSRNNNNALHVVGYDADIDKQQRAQKLGAIDEGQWSLIRAVEKADLVVLATPIGAMREIFENIADHAQDGSVVTDTGSTKANVLQWADELLPRRLEFVGGHPMAGRSESLEAADADLFAGATWCVCPSVHASDNAIQTVLGMISALGAEPFFVDPVEHDGYVAGISHLPFILSAALMQTLASDPSWRDMQTLSSSGFRDTTRLALGSPQMHRDIALTNRQAILRWLDQLDATLYNVRSMLTETDEEASSEQLGDFFTKAQDARARWEVKSPRAAEQASVSQQELGSVSVGEQMGRLFLGGLGKRRKPRGVDKTNNDGRRDR